ncbi:hypothetical protein [Nocardioides sp. L-11A]|uniref:hypothetical protein n=1 Tax=Nocardioides sp. L-11A TaxID=3043848 RepID=UPI00249C4584|nr:hypothetical protein QJ852_16680 [Nocardioides sp. L-11A]
MSRTSNTPERSGGADGVARWWRENPAATLEEVTDIASRPLWSGLPRLDTLRIDP